MYMVVHHKACIGLKDWLNSTASRRGRNLYELHLSCHGSLRPLPTYIVSILRVVCLKDCEDILAVSASAQKLESMTEMAPPEKLHAACDECREFPCALIF